MKEDESEQKNDSPDVAYVPAHALATLSVTKSQALKSESQYLEE